MSGKTVTRADLAESVFRKVGLSRTESAELVETVIDEICNAIVRGESVKLSSFAARTISSRKLRMTLWLGPVMPTFWPARTSAHTTRAPVWVLPVPGGPWIGSTLSSRSRASRLAESRVVSPARASSRAGPERRRGGRFRRRSRAARNRPGASMP